MYQHRDEEENTMFIKKTSDFMLTVNSAVLKLEKFRIIEIRAIETAIPRLISICEKLVQEKYAEYIRFTTEEVQSGETGNNKVVAVARMKLIPLKNTKQVEQKNTKYVEKHNK